MDPTNVAGAIPFTAWQQAVFVVLFIVMVLGLLAWFSKQQDNWQSFISKRDEQWQVWMKETNCQTTDSLEHMTKALEKLSEKFDTHDDKVEGRINGAVAKIKSTRKAK